MKQSRIKDEENNCLKLETTVKQAIIEKIIAFLTCYMCITMAKRIICLVILVYGRPLSNITESTGLCRRTISNYIKIIKTGNIDSLLEVKGGGRKRTLKDVEQDLINEVNSNNYCCLQQINDMCYEKFGIKTTNPTISRVLKKYGIKRLKSGSLPAKADPIAQRKFYDKTLKPLIEKAKSGVISLIYIDASHFVMGCNFLGYIYGVGRRLITTFSDRKRFNVLGALDFLTKKVTTITNDSYIRAAEVCDLLWKIALEYKGKDVYIVLDNASYQKCKEVQNFAAEININLIFIPPYSPNLNLIERFWKHVKGKLRTRYFNNFQNFCETINSIVACKDHALDSLISDNVQFFDDLVQLNETTFATQKKVKSKSEMALAKAA